MALKAKRVITACRDDDVQVLERWYAEGNSFEFLYNRRQKVIKVYTDDGEVKEYIRWQRFFDPFDTARNFENFRSMVCMLKRGYPIEDLKARQGFAFGINAKHIRRPLSRFWCSIWTEASISHKKKRI